MRYIRIEEIKEGMRTAKPIYNDMGVLLYGRNTIVNDMFFKNIETLDLYGMYILEPTEPLPPVTDEEHEFERFQTVTYYALKREIEKFLEKDPTFSLNQIVEDIMHHYGNLTQKINFLQTIRSNKDYAYKHSLSVAMLCSIICAKMGVEKKETEYIVAAALVHDLGKIIAPPEIIGKTDKLTVEELRIVREAEAKGYDLVKNNYTITAGIRRYLMQLSGELENRKAGRTIVDQKLLLGTKIIRVADMFDILTAMRVYKEPMSEFQAIKFFQSHDEYDESIVKALTETINILPVGVCVLLTNGEKGLILSHSEYYLLRPTVLGLSTNTVYDLSNKKTYEEVQIKDILKTMDNRFMMKEEVTK